MEDDNNELVILKRLAVRLVAMAGLAGRCAAYPWPVRRFVLWVLRWALSAIEPYVLDTLMDYGLPAPDLPQRACESDSIADAHHLDATMRALAQALSVMIDEIERGALYFEALERSAPARRKSLLPACWARLAKTVGAQRPPADGASRLPRLMKSLFGESLYGLIEPANAPRAIDTS